MIQEKNEDGGWSPYVAGGLSGLVIIGSVLWTGKFFGASTSFVRSVGMLEKFFDPDPSNPGLLFPLNRTGRLGRDVIYHSVHAPDLVDNAVGNAAHQFIGKF